MLFNQKLFLDQFFNAKSLQHREKKICFHFDNIAEQVQNEAEKKQQSKSAWIRAILFISADFSSDLEYRSNSCCMCVKLNEPNFSLLSQCMWMESFRNIAIILTSKKPHKSWRFLPLDVNNAKEKYKVLRHQTVHSVISPSAEIGWFHSVHTHTWLQ